MNIHDNANYQPLRLAPTWYKPTPSTLASFSQPPRPHERMRHFETSLQPLLETSALSGRLNVLTLVDLITDYGPKDVDLPTRLEILTKIIDRAGVMYFQAWCDYTPSMHLIQEWLKTAVNPSKTPFAESLLPLLKFLNLLPLSAKRLNNSKLGELLEQIAANTSSSVHSSLTARNLIQKWQLERVMSNDIAMTDRVNGLGKAESMVLDFPQPTTNYIAPLDSIPTHSPCTQCQNLGFQCDFSPDDSSGSCQCCFSRRLECSFSTRYTIRRRWKQWTIALVSNAASQTVSDDDSGDIGMSEEPSQPSNSPSSAPEIEAWPNLTMENVLEYVEAALRVTKADQSRWTSDDSGASILFAVFKAIISEKPLYQQMLAFRGDDAQLILNSLQLLLDHPRWTNGLNKHNFLKALLRLSNRSGLYPECLVLKGVERSEQPITAGHFAEVYRGRFRGHDVGLKVVKIYECSQLSKILKVVSREAIIWSHLSHCNLLPFYGIYHLDNDNGRACLVSPWMQNGNVTEYLSRNPDVDRLLLVSDIAVGVLYLHENNIVHGDLKGVNILVAPSGRACLADFGLSNLVDSELLSWTSLSSTSVRGGTTRWQAPELFDPDDDHPMATKMTDIYSFSCVCYEIFTNNLPFYEYPRDATVMLKVMAGQRPSRPNADSQGYRRLELTDDLWTLMEECWQRDPDIRPEAAEVLQEPCFRNLVDTRPEGLWDDFSASQFRIAMNMLADN